MRNITWKNLHIISICVIVGIIVLLIVQDYDPILKAKERILERDWAVFQKVSEQHKNTDQNTEYDEQIPYFQDTVQENLPTVDERDKKYINSLYSIDEMKQAYMFAERIKQFVNSKNITAFAELVSFPITINLNGTELKVNNEAEFVKLNTKEIFPDNFVQEICDYEDLSISSEGFMMGNNPNLLFSFNKNGLPRIYALNI